MTCKNGAPPEYCNCGAKPEDKVKFKSGAKSATLMCAPPIPPTGLTEKDLMARGWSKVGNGWFKAGAIMCNRRRSGTNQEMGATFADAVKIEGLMDEWVKS